MTFLKLVCIRYVWSLDAFFDKPESFSIQFCQPAGPALPIRNVFRSTCGHAAFGLRLHCSSEGWGNSEKCPSHWRTGDCRKGKILSFRGHLLGAQIQIAEVRWLSLALCTDWCKWSADTSRQAGTAEHLRFAGPKVPQNHHHWRGGEHDMSLISFGAKKKKKKHNVKWF